MAEGETLAYDLRQKYAEIVGFHLEAIAMARIKKNFPDYFNALEDLETIINHKYKGKKKTEEYGEIKAGKKKTEKKSLEEEYNELREVAINLANKYKTAFMGATNDPEHVAKIQESLRAIERFFYKVMDKAKMFGSSGYNEGL